ncbi:hypothetical protein JHK85_057795 [Glycine max]|nr:hypothetical protein JHK85_057795 [Glycine max]KHN01033.1 hypothetical protein glysoja_000701 [Glycine soja]
MTQLTKKEKSTLVGFLTKREKPQPKSRVIENSTTEEFYAKMTTLLLFTTLPVYYYCY